MADRTEHNQTTIPEIARILTSILLPHLSKFSLSNSHDGRSSTQPVEPFKPDQTLQEPTQLPPKPPALTNSPQSETVITTAQSLNQDIIALPYSETVPSMCVPVSNKNPVLVPAKLPTVSSSFDISPHQSFNPAQVQMNLLFVTRLNPNSTPETAND
ncbi:hypothetical protein NE237_012133 [Protea cynaroides]|uniref:Uncharacterized protein n=1 Tax=Protea cynaroides TaxID=273540 RepID=A0A9Q0GXH8_9MAGN|nr:hypothetical protein NE237_012133 [Protea cynaroides]